MNALNEEVLTELYTAFDTVDLNKTRCIVLTGAGEKAFAAGADIAAMKNFDQTRSKKFAELGVKVFQKIDDFQIPVIAAVNGYALGGGCELAMACDIRIASENAVFGLPETGLGIIPGFGGTQRLMRLVPEGRAKEMIFSGSKLDARAAKETGLVNEVYPREKLLENALHLACQIGRKAPIAVRKAKQSMNGGRTKNLEEGLRLETNCFADCFGTADQRHGMEAFLAKQKVIKFENR